MTASEARKQLPAREADFHRSALKTLILSLAGIYQGMSGREPGISFSPSSRAYDGPFFRFVIACLLVYRPQEAKNRQALGKSIQRFLKDARTTMDKSSSQETVDLSIL